MSLKPNGEAAAYKAATSGFDSRTTPRVAASGKLNVVCGEKGLADRVVNL